MKTKIIYFIIITGLLFLGTHTLFGGKFLPLLILTSVSTLISIWVIDDFDDFIVWLLGGLMSVASQLVLILISMFITITISRSTGEITNTYYQSGYRSTSVISTGKSVIIIPGGNYTNYYADFTSSEYGQQVSEITGTQYENLHSNQKVVVVKKVDILGNIHYKIKD